MKKRDGRWRAVVLALAVGFGAGYGLRPGPPAQPAAAPAAERAPLTERMEMTRVAERLAEVQGERLVMRTEAPWSIPPAPSGLKAADDLSPGSCATKVVKFVQVGNDWEGHGTRPVLTNKSSVPLRDIRARIDINGREKVWVFPLIAPGQTVRGEGRLASPEDSLIRIGFSVSEGNQAYAPLGRGKTADPCAEGEGRAGYFRLGE